MQQVTGIVVSLTEGRLPTDIKHVKNITPYVPTISG